ncbi:hypothetical protein J3R83DRAFT_8479, partial [Lanmaoa asiatica]
MPIAPITGKLRKAFWRDVSLSLGLGIGAGYAFWCVHLFFHFSSLSHLRNKVWLPSQSRYDHAHSHENLNSIYVVQRREEHYLKLEQERARSQAA